MQKHGKCNSGHIEEIKLQKEIVKVLYTCFYKGTVKFKELGMMEISAQEVTIIDFKLEMIRIKMKMLIGSGLKENIEKADRLVYIANESYYLEDKIANYPRIIIDKKVVNEIKQDSQLCEYSEYIRKDFDNLYFLNFLNDCYFCGQMLMNGFEKMQKEVGKGIDEKTYQKFCWHMNFVNSELDRKNDKKDRKYRLSMILEYE